MSSRSAAPRASAASPRPPRRSRHAGASRSKRISRRTRSFGRFQTWARFRPMSLAGSPMPVTRKRRKTARPSGLSNLSASRPWPSRSTQPMSLAVSAIGARPSALSEPYSASPTPVSIRRAVRPAIPPAPVCGQRRAPVSAIARIVQHIQEIECMNVCPRERGMDICSSIATNVRFGFPATRSTTFENRRIATIALISF
jgi:hypothetical protein